MIKKLYKLIKKIVIGSMTLYGYNVLVPMTVIIPINIVTIILLSFFGIPALIFLIIIKTLIY